MVIKKKHMSRSSWSRIIDKKYITIDIKEKEFKGKVSLLYMMDVKEPLIKKYDNKTITIADKNYYWLQIAIEGKNYWITAMYDNNGKLVQYYIDITRKNHIKNDDPYFEDLFLDIVILPNGKKFYLDMDELNKAFYEKIIEKDEYDLAIHTAEDIQNKILNNKKEFDDFCYKYFINCKLKIEV